MENRKKRKESSSSKDSNSYSYKSEFGECPSFWLLKGPPFDQRDYMISPSESSYTSVNEKVSESSKKDKKLAPCDIKIDSKYLIDSQKALRKICELIKDRNAVELTDRIEELIRFFLDGSPMGFVLDDLQMVIEIVEYFARNMNSVPEYSKFVKTIMGYAMEPPKVGTVLKVLAFRHTLVDYFTLFGELLATFEDECFQMQLLEALDCLIIRRKLVDIRCIKLSFCQETMEESQLPCVVGTLLETIPDSLYVHYLELALQMIWVSVKTGCLMVQTGALDYVIWRMDPTPNEEPNLSADDLDAPYKLIDKSVYLIWSFFAIISKCKLEIPVPQKRALRSLKSVFQRESKNNTQKAIQIRNSLAGIITKLYSLFREKLCLQHTGLVGDIAALAVATEIKPKIEWLADIKLGTNIEDFLFKRIMLLCCCLFSQNEALLVTLKKHKIIEGVLCLINPKTTLPWIPSQFLILLLLGFRSLSEYVPKFPDVYLSQKGNEKFLNTIKWIVEDYFTNEEMLLEALKSFCRIVTCGNEAIVEDLKAQDDVTLLIDVCFLLLDVTFMTLEQQDKLSRVFVLLDALLRNDRKLQEKFSVSCCSISLKFLKRVLADSGNDTKWNSSILVSFGGFLWEAVAWCSETLKAFIKGNGIFLLLDFIESTCFPLQLLFLGVLVDMTDEGETIVQLLVWRGKNGNGILCLLIDIWRKEEFMNKVHRTKDGVIEDVETPLMTEEQWYMTHHVIGGHMYSPSIAEMVCSVRPKIHALYQFLQRRYFQLTQIGESTYSLHLKMIQPSYKVYLPLIEHYLALKMGEIWWEVVDDAYRSGVFPSSFDGHVMCTLLDEKNEWACRVQKMQQEILMDNLSHAADKEKKFYAFLKSCQLPDALEAMHELDFIARTSYKKFQKMKRESQLSQREKCLKDTNIVFDDFCHGTFLMNTNVTVVFKNFMRAKEIRIKSQKLLTQEGPRPVSPIPCEVNFNFDKGIDS